MILPPATLGILGGGQLGRYFTLAARDMGYRVIVLDPEAHCPAASVADEHVQAGYDDAVALNELARRCAAITTEFESVPAESLRQLAQHVPVHPAAEAVAICQDRLREKRFLATHKLPHAAFASIASADDLKGLDPGLFPGILKVIRCGYDGKGQARVRDAQEAAAAFARMGYEPCVLEQMLPLDAELSVVLARGADGSIECFTASENQHQDGILDVSIVPPSRIIAERQKEARSIACEIAQQLDYVGTLAVEFFLVGERLLVNEIAPRPHNSGHWTLDACSASQFEQQVRALCGLPLAKPDAHSSAVMVNLLGGLWEPCAPDFSSALSYPALKLHLYGKQQARRGRKMGHFTVLDDSVIAALHIAGQVKARMQTRQGGNSLFTPVP